MNGRRCVDVAAMLAFGESLAKQLAPNGVVLLRGPLGAGKTVLAKGIARGLGIAVEAIQSPTFTIVAEHRGPIADLIHLDLYRLDGAEIDALGIDELVAGPGVAVIEWAERWPAGWPGALEIDIRVEHDGARMVEVGSGMR